jgi:peptide/nickel transport system permease protein
MSAETQTLLVAPGPGEVTRVTDRQRSPLLAALLTTIRRPMAIVSIAWLGMVVVTSVFASQIAPYGPLDQDILNTLAKPSSHHLLGTDDVGRDILSRLLHGGGALMAASLEAVVVAVLIGVPLGMIAGYIGGKSDAISSFVVNVLIAIPGFVILVAIVVASGNRLWIVMGVLGVLFSANFFRLVRAATRSSRDLPYVESARVAGLTSGRILSRHVLPNVTGPLVVQAFLTFSIGLIIATSLAFLGLGVSPETPSWGQMIYVATQNLSTDPWMMVPVGVVLIATILAMNFLGSALRDALPQAQRQRLLVDPHITARQAPHSIATPVELDATRDAPPDDLLTVTGVTVSFPGPAGEQAVVDGVTFAVGRGKTLGLVGESGCGKTMTALALMGLVPPPGQISSGSIVLDGREMTGLTEKERSAMRGSEIALVSQEPMVALDPCFTVGSLLMEPLRRHRKLSRKDAAAEAQALLKLVGISRPEAVSRSFPHQISGGMAQRVGIALALTGHPKLLVADEPTTALDVTIQAEILDLLRSLQEQLGMTVVIVTHDLGVVADICTDVAVMYAGQVVEMGSAADVLDHPTHPYTRALLGAVPDLAAPGRPLPTVKGTVPLPKDWPVFCRFADRCPVAIPECRNGAIPLVLVGDDRVSRCIRTGSLADSLVNIEVAR